MRVQIYLKDGREINVVVEEFQIHRSTISGEIRSLTWRPRSDSPSLKHVDIDEIVAIVTYPDSADSQAVQDERNGEQAEAGSDQVDPGRDVEGGDSEQDGRDQEEQ